MRKSPFCHDPKCVGGLVVLPDTTVVCPVCATHNLGSGWSTESLTTSKGAVNLSLSVGGRVEWRVSE